MSKKKYIFWLILCASVGLRVIALSSRGIAYDDAFSIFLARRSLAEIVSGTAADTMPPLYYFLLHFWMMVGENIVWIRMLSGIFSLGCVVILYFIVKDLQNEKAGLWAAAIAGLSPFQIYYAQEVRMYSLLAFCQLLYFLAFIKLFVNPDARKNRWWAVLILGGTAAMYTHNLAVFGLAAANVYLILRKEWKQLYSLLIAQAITAVCTLPWLLLVPGQVAKIQHAFWTPRPGIVEVIQASILFNAYLPLPRIWMVIAAILSLQIAALVVLETWKLRNETVAVLLSVFVIAPPLLLFVLSYVMRPVFVPRGFILSALVYDALIGVILSRTRVAGVRVYLAASVVLAAVISLPYQYTYQLFPRSNYKESMIYLEKIVHPGDVILHDNKLSYFPSVFYDSMLPQVFLMDETGSHNDTLAPKTQKAIEIYPKKDLEVAVGTSRHVFFIAFERAITEFASVGDGEHPVLQKLRDGWITGKETHFGDLIVFEFSR